MASTLTRIRDEVKVLVDAVYASKFPAGIPMPFGRLERDEHSAPWRVAWVPGEGTDAPAVKSGNGNPRSVGTVVQRFMVQCWADNFDNAWELLMVVRRCVYLAAHGSFAFRGHVPLSEADLAAYNLEGHAWELRVDFAIPITDAVLATVVVPEDKTDHQSGFEGSAEIGCRS